MKSQVCFQFEKRDSEKKQRAIQFTLVRVDESLRIKLRLILLFLIAETTASTGGASARKAKTPWSLLRLVSSAKGKMHFFSVFFFARSHYYLSKRPTSIVHVIIYFHKVFENRSKMSHFQLQKNIAQLKVSDMYCNYFFITVITNYQLYL